MPVSFQILPERNLSYVRYEGVIEVADAEGGFGAYMRHPDYAPGQLQLIDLAAATGWTGDFMQIMRLQATKAGVFLRGQPEVMLVYHAPTDVARGITAAILRSWQGIKGVVPVVQDSEAGALAVLGQPEASFAELLRNARRDPRQRRA